MPHKNPEEAKAWRRSWWKTATGSRTKQNAAAARRHNEINSFLRAYKIANGCSGCGFNSHHAALEFHHVGDDKAINLSFAKSMAQAKRELKKCSVLCANCHRIHHWEESHPCKPDIFEVASIPARKVYFICRDRAVKWCVYFWLVMFGGLVCPQSGAANLVPVESCQTTYISNATPTKTKKPQTQAVVSSQGDDASRTLIDLSNAEMHLSKVEMEASIREASIGKMEGQLAKVWWITAIAVLSLGVIVLAVMAVYSIKTGDVP